MPSQEQYQRDAALNWTKGDANCKLCEGRGWVYDTSAVDFGGPANFPVRCDCVINRGEQSKYLFSQRDLDNRDVELRIRECWEKARFQLIITDASNNGKPNSKVELEITEKDLKTIVDRLTKVLKNEW